MVVFGEWAQVEAIELVNDGTGLAFGIVGGRSSGVVIKTILPGGIAEKDGRLRSGDRLLRIGCVSVVGMCARQAASVLRQCGATVRLLVARPAHHAHQLQLHEGCQAPIVQSRLLGDPLELELYLGEQGYQGFPFAHTVPAPILDHQDSHVRRPMASVVAVVPPKTLKRHGTTPPSLISPPALADKSPKLPLDMAIRGEPETLTYDVTLKKDSELPLGITVAGYVCELEELSGIFVKSIAEGSSADLSGKIRVNDQIVEVDGVSLSGVSNHTAVGILRDARGPLVRLRAVRYLRGAGFDKLQRALSAQPQRAAPPSPSATSLVAYEYSVYEESTVVEAEESAVGHPPSPTSPDDVEIVLGAEPTGDEDVRKIQDKWRERLEGEPGWPGHDDGYDIIVGTVVKDSGAGLGLSLEGTATVVGGKEVQARHYIRAILPNSAVDRSKLFRVGDELLEVNGGSVLGEHHVVVVNRLRTVTSWVRLVCARRRSGLGRQLIDTAHDSAAFKTRNILSGSLHNILAPMQRLIKAKSESSVSSLCSAATVLQAPDREFQTEDLDRNKSRSLEPMSNLAMWSDSVEYIELLKEDRGLGFSILDYLDPLEEGSSVLVVRSLVDGGAAARDGRLSPGDRLVSVNGIDISKCRLGVAVNVIKSTPNGLVTIGVSKPLPCSTVVGGEKASGSTQDVTNSNGSDDQTTMDSFHECLQEYEEGSEMVQICHEPEDSIKEDEMSLLEDLSLEEQRLEELKIMELERQKPSTSDTAVNVCSKVKFSKSDDSIDLCDDVTITEDTGPRDLSRSKSADRGDRSSLSKEQSKEISTSDEMVFAVTPTGLERITYENYWSQEPKFEGVFSKLAPSDDSPHDISIMHDSSILYIDYEGEGYETCLDDTSTAEKTAPIEVDSKPNDYKATFSSGFISKTDNAETKNNKQWEDDGNEFPKNPYVQDHIIKQMQCLRIEPTCLKYTSKKRKSLSKTKPKYVEYYNDQAECLEEYKKQKEIEKNDAEIDGKGQPTETIITEKQKTHDSRTQKGQRNSLKQPQRSERSMSAPSVMALMHAYAVVTDSDEKLFVPAPKGRRKSAGPLRYVLPPRRPSLVPTMTVSVCKEAQPEQVLAQRWGPPRQVTLKRNDAGALGISIVGGKVDISANKDEATDDKGIVGIFIKNIVPNSPAGISGELQPGDRILEVDGVCLRSAPHARAVQIIKSAGDEIVFTVQSLLPWSEPLKTMDGLSSLPSAPAQVTASPIKTKPAIEDNGIPEHDIKITVTGTEDEIVADEITQENPVYSSDEEDSDNEDERDLGGKVYTAKNVEIDRASAGAVKRSKEEAEADPESEDDFGYTTNKIRKRWGGLGETLLCVRLQRGALGRGLGLSLAGHRDRTRMAVFVCGLHPAGGAARAQPLIKPGDEILEVNGLVLHGRCHLNASPLIKGLPGPIFKVVLLRRKQGLEDLAVKPIVQYPVEIDEDVETRYASYKDVRNVYIKKVTKSLGIMILEGKHAEAGQGIFISDIQEGSAAEEAGLQVGDMLLAVNRDDLLSCSYDEAAQMLRRAEGMVVLTVCNPNVKGTPTTETAGKAPSRPVSRQSEGAAKTLSRPTTPKPAESPIKAEPPPDPATTPIVPNKPTVIEVKVDDKNLGIMLIGGSDTPVKGGAIIHEVFPDGRIGLDGRLRPGDQILECNGVAITDQMTEERIHMSVKQPHSKMKMTVFRPEPLQFEEVVVDLARKPKTGLGIGFVNKKSTQGVYIKEIFTGGAAHVDGRLARGDFIISIDGQDFTAAEFLDAAMALKLIGAKTTVKVKRFKFVRPQ